MEKMISNNNCRLFKSCRINGCLKKWTNTRNWSYW